MSIIECKNKTHIKQLVSITLIDLKLIIILKHNMKSILNAFSKTAQVAKKAIIQS